jgi:hypothetical protein
MRHGRRLDKGDSPAHERKLNETLARTLLGRHLGDIKENIDWRQTAIRLGRFLSEIHSVPVDDLQSLEITVCSDLKMSLLKKRKDSQWTP